MIVGLAGYARSGKDEAAKALVGQGWERRAFADVLRNFVLAVNPIVDIQEYYPRAFSKPEHRVIRVSDVIEQFGWDGYKESPYGEEIRGLLQRMGTEGGRKLISDTIWIDATIGDYTKSAMNFGKSKLVVTDVRFPNEFDAIVNSGGMMIRIYRPGVGAANDHISEHALDGYKDYYDKVIYNVGSINELHDKVRRAVALHFG